MRYVKEEGETNLHDASFGGGRITASEGASGAVYTANYYITDHLGSTRAIYNGSPDIVRSDFLPYGTRWNNGQAATSRYQFTGYEDQELLDRNYMDAGARFYNSVRFHTPDPLAEKYYSTSPYAYCVNNPVNAFDPDGEKVIFVNGYPLGSLEPGKNYWNDSFIAGAQKYFKDNSTYYVPHSPDGNSSADDRYKNGYDYAKENYGNIVDGMTKGETFKFVSHSMGGAFAAGMRDYILEKAEWQVEEEVYINTFQSKDTKISEKSLIIDYQNTNDLVLGVILNRGQEMPRTLSI